MTGSSCLWLNRGRKCLVFHRASFLMLDGIAVRLSSIAAAAASQDDLDLDLALVLVIDLDLALALEKGKKEKPRASYNLSMLRIATVECAKTMAFEAAWSGECGSTRRVNLLVPKGTYLLGPVRFAGPCTNVSSLMVTVKNIKFISMKKPSVHRVTSVNSKSFHIALVECEGFRGSGINISTLIDSPITDGIHIERSSGVYISKSRIRTGADCISIGQGNSLMWLTYLSFPRFPVGSLGRYQHEGNVSGVVVQDCNMTGMANGIRIKTWPDSPDSSIVTNMTFENIRMNNVTNLIIID
ncbi:exopolygalacturonase-like [Eucalyptus grandis]|uniref:exopolygalacturonase-like n=1 Tax=Eucalyptus grandis TaxID=71139 RepID=UPI00192EE18D|nr:exopolygalacturonase-like [Eucalyptus grandis]